MKTLLWIWQLPQNLLGRFIVAICDARKTTYMFIGSHDIYIANRFRGGWGVSLGDYIIFGYNKPTLQSKSHEYGHQIQSRRLGWFYLIIIGIPSVLGNRWDKIMHKNWSYEEREEWYYKKLPWERNADKLGNVGR